ncbi:Fork-head transcriptional regulator, partial [Lachnellula willkommii]
MNSEHYRRRPQINSLPLNFQYAESSGTPMQSTHQMLSFDGLPRAQNDQQFMITPSAVPNTVSDNYSLSLTTPMAMPQATTVWSDPNHTPMDFDSQNTNDYYDYSPSITVDDNEQDSPFLRAMSYSEVPRTCFPCDPRMLNDGGNMAVDSFDASAYLMDPNKHDMQTSTEPTSLGFDALENSHNFSRLSISHSPKLEHETPTSDHFTFNKPTLPLPSSEPSEDGISSREMTAVDGDDPSADEPYAKLIHRALMSAPDHSMVLQEIYEWFRKHTAKGASDTKGWMNSIRHNLSMNAAFKKTERKTPGDETKKSTEWVLEEFAIKDGVQSTTRYRKGTGAKKFMKTENPAPSRQSSGRKGGISASKTKMQRQQQRSISSTHRSRHGHEFLRSHFPTQRYSSPLTPPTHENIPGAGCNPYFFPKQQLEYEDMCGLQDVQGVYIDDNGPIFAESQDYASADGLP